MAVQTGGQWQRILPFKKFWGYGRGSLILANTFGDPSVEKKGTGHVKECTPKKTCLRREQKGWEEVLFVYGVAKQRDLRVCDGAMTCYTSVRRKGPNAET